MPRLDLLQAGSQLLENGVRALAIVTPLATAKLLIEAVADMLLLQTGHGPAEPDLRKDDASEIWAPRVDQKRHPYSDSKAELVRTLTFASEQVYQRGDLKEIEQLDRALQNAQWHVFDRIRYHLYAKFPDQVREWIRESILNYSGYFEEQYGFEFQRMIRVATEHFGASLLTRDELTRIFEIILSGPNKEDYKQFMGERFSEEGYRRRQQYFHQRQFRPFAAVLFGKYQDRYSSVIADDSELTDDDFVRYGSGESKVIVSQSPKTLADLANLTDKELISFLNAWEEATRDPEKWWVEIDFAGLASAFEQLIIANPNRFLSWGSRWHALERPIYFRYALSAAAKRISDHPTELPQWLGLAEWIMARTNSASDPKEKTSETSRNQPNWDGARRQVVDFIGACINKDVNVSLEWR
jgi:hypothetical protein